MTHFRTPDAGQQPPTSSDQTPLAGDGAALGSDDLEQVVGGTDVLPKRFVPPRTLDKLGNFEIQI